MRGQHVQPHNAEGTHAPLVGGAARPPVPPARPACRLHPKQHATRAALPACHRPSTQQHATLFAHPACRLHQKRHTGCPSCMPPPTPKAACHTCYLFSMPPPPPKALTHLLPVLHAAHPKARLRLKLDVLELVDAQRLKGLLDERHVRQPAQRRGHGRRLVEAAKDDEEHLGEINKKKKEGSGWEGYGYRGSEDAEQEHSKYVEEPK